MPISYLACFHQHRWISLHFTILFKGDSDGKFPYVIEKTFSKNVASSPLHIVGENKYGYQETEIGNIGRGGMQTPVLEMCAVSHLAEFQPLMSARAWTAFRCHDRQKLDEENL